MDGFGQFLIDHVYSLRHWPFFAVAVIFMAIGEVVKRSLWTVKRARRQGRMRWFWYTGRVTLPLHPVFVGFLVGLVWTEPERYVSGPAACFYFAAAGTLSVWLYQIIKAVLRRQGLRVEEVYSPFSDEVTRPDKPSSFPPGILHNPNVPMSEPPGCRPERPTVPYERGKRDGGES